MTATGEKAEDGLRLEEAEALGELGRDEVAQRHVVDQHDQADRGRGLLRDAPIGTSPVITAISASKSMPQASSGSAIGSRGPRKASEPPWYISGSVQKRRRHLGAAGLAHQLDVVHIGRAVRPLIGARQGRGAIVLVEAEGRAPSRARARGEIGEARAVALPVVEGRLQRRRDDKGVGRPRQVFGDDDEPAVAALLEGGEFHDPLMTLSRNVRT